MPLMDEFKEEREAMKNQPFKKRLSYFWEYNKVPVIITLAVVTMITSFVYNIITRKDVVLWVALVDCMEVETDAPSYEKLLSEQLGINTAKEEVDLDASYLISASSDMADNSLTEALSVRVATGEIDAFVSGETFFSAYSLADVFVDLRTVLTPEQIATYENDFYYLDYAHIEKGDTDNGTNDIDYLNNLEPRNPEKMEKPIPIGIYVTPTDDFAQQYANASGEDLVFGIIYNHGNIDYITTFLDTMTGHTN